MAGFFLKFFLLIDENYVISFFVRRPFRKAKNWPPRREYPLNKRSTIILSREIR